MWSQNCKISFNSPKCVKLEKNRLEGKPNKLLTNGSGMENQQEESVKEPKRETPREN